MRVRSAALLVFGLLCCLYALTAGGQGYSVDGTFSYGLSRDLAAGDWRVALDRNRDVLRRWGPVVPLLGLPFTWAGERLGALAPPRDSAVVGGRRLALYDWPPLGAPAGGASEPGGADPVAQEAVLALPQPAGATRLTVVSFLSFATDLPDGAPVAELTLDSGVTATLRAGSDTAEWAYDVPGAARPRHARAPLAGHWPGNPAANLYAATLPLATASRPATRIAVRYVAPSGRLHLRAVVLDGPGGAVAASGPQVWSDADQAALFGRFGFSFLNVPLMAATAALLVPLAALLGYGLRSGVLLALGFGLTTLAWPYAKHDFSETAVGFLALAALTLLYAAGRAAGRRAAALTVAAGASACLAAGAKYTAAWFIPLLVVQLGLLRWPAGARLAASGSERRAALVAVGQLASVPILLALAVVGRSGAPLLWVDWRGALAREWLNFSPWEGLYGLLLSPGKSVFLYAPPLALAVAGAWAFVRRQRLGSFVFLAVPALYLLVFASKGVWHGGGWGPRYLVPALPFAACLALPVVDAARRRGGAWRWAPATLAALGLGVQLLGVAKHPNLYTIMFRDHVAPQLPDYGAHLDGRPAEDYWRHFGGPEAGRQLLLPPSEADKSLPARGLGYAYAESRALRLTLDLRRDGPFDLTMYVCDWDHRGRRQIVSVADRQGEVLAVPLEGFAACQYLSVPVEGQAGQPVTVEAHATGAETPVLSALFFDPPGGGAQIDTLTGGRWVGRYGRDGYVLFAWLRGGRDLAQLPAYVAGYRGGDRVWLDTGEEELAETAPLYVPAFSPLLAHAWLLGADAIHLLLPGNPALLQRALGSPPWRELAGMEVHPSHPEYGLGLDFWPALLFTHFSSQRGMIAVAVVVELALAAGAAWSALRLVRWLGTPDYPAGSVRGGR